MTGVPLLFECLYAMLVVYSSDWCTLYCLSVCMPCWWFTVVTGVPLLFECLYAMLVVYSSDWCTSTV